MIRKKVGIGEIVPILLKKCNMQDIFKRFLVFLIFSFSKKKKAFNLLYFKGLSKSTNLSVMRYFFNMRNTWKKW